MAVYTVGACRHCGKNVSGQKKYCSVECKFWPKVDVRSPDECWPWTGAVLKNSGYGVLSISSTHKTRLTTAHRVALAIKLGRPVTDDLHACHSCDNPSCVNPKHVFEGSAKTNNEDKVSKNRQCKGDKHGRSRLTEEQARAILADPRTHEVIAAEYGVARTAITRIKNGTRWRHLTN